ncbi:MAG TPA: hypothetical protein VLM88_04460 [Proteiniclasticum sp.]|nr:hypothetical protein [Proteiniclasticum sp.]
MHLKRASFTHSTTIKYYVDNTNGGEDLITLLLDHKKRFPDYYISAINKYCKRLSRYCNLSIEALENVSEITPLVTSFYIYHFHVKGKALDSVSFIGKDPGPYTKWSF